jgi:hypothetical protein
MYVAKLSSEIARAVAWIDTTLDDGALERKAAGHGRRGQ